MNWDETNIHTLLTQALAGVVGVIALLHPGTNAITIPDALVTAASVIGAAVASGLHALHVKKSKTITVTPAVALPKATTTTMEAS